MYCKECFLYLVQMQFESFYCVRVSLLVNLQTILKESLLDRHSWSYNCLLRFNWPYKFPQSCLIEWPTIITLEVQISSREVSQLYCESDLQELAAVLNKIKADNTPSALMLLVVYYKMYVKLYRKRSSLLGCAAVGIIQDLSWAGNTSILGLSSHVPSQNTHCLVDSSCGLHNWSRVNVLYYHTTTIHHHWKGKNTKAW